MLSSYCNVTLFSYNENKSWSSSPNRIEFNKFFTMITNRENSDIVVCLFQVAPSTIRLHIQSYQFHLHKLHC